MIDGAMLKRINDEHKGKDPDQLCHELGVDPDGAREAMAGIGFHLPPEGQGTVAIALFIGIQAGQESQL